MVTIETPCAICGASAYLQEGSSAGDRRLSCHRCGHYRITVGAAEHLRNEPSLEPLRPFIAAHVRQANAAGEETPVINEGNVVALAEAHAHTSVATKLRLLLEYLERASLRSGAQIDFKGLQTAYPLFDVVNADELVCLLRELDARGDVSWVGGYVTVLEKGWERRESLDPVGGASVAGLCFVSMSFDPRLNDAYRDGFAKAIADAGYSGGRVDRARRHADIADRIRSEIRRSQFVIADFTRQPQRVYYEAGFAEGLGKPVIRTCRDSDFDRLHFDTRQFFHLRWSDPEDLRRSLADHIRLTIGSFHGDQRRSDGRAERH